MKATNLSTLIEVVQERGSDVDIALIRCAPRRFGSFAATSTAVLGSYRRSPWAHTYVVHDRKVRRSNLGRP